MSTDDAAHYTRAALRNMLRGHMALSDEPSELDIISVMIMARLDMNRAGGDSMTTKSEQEAQLRAATHLPAPPVITPAQRAERQRKLRNAK